MHPLPVPSLSLRDASDAASLPRRRCVLARQDIRRELVTIQRMLNRAAGTPSAGAAALTKHEASPMDVATAGELVFRVQRLRVAGARWLRGWLKTDILTDANELLDSGRLSVLQRAQLANSLLRRLDNSKALIHHW